MAGHNKINWLNEPIEPALGRGLGSIFGSAPVAPALGLAGVFGQTSPPTMADALGTFLRSAVAEGPCRSRSSWNDRFTHWERPESVSEGGTIERAEANVSAAIAGNSWLKSQHVRVEGQGSYFNRTNVRREADIDLRIVHPLLKVDYAANVHLPSARGMLGYRDVGLTFQQIFNGLRVNLVRDLSTRFGRSNVEVGKKAIRIKGITGSRAEVDVVPAIRYHHVTWLTEVQRYQTLEGIAILATDDRWTFNFPEQHTANGRAKRARTGHQFKRVVRIFKRMQADMVKAGIAKARVPSFLIECLVHAVEDPYFTVPTDDRYGRIRRIAWRMRELLSDTQTAFALTEINGIKWLFHADQAWRHADALAFVDAVIVYMGDA